MTNTSLLTWVFGKCLIGKTTTKTKTLMRDEKDRIPTLKLKTLYDLTTNKIN